MRNDVYAYIGKLEHKGPEGKKVVELAFSAAWKGKLISRKEWSTEDPESSCVFAGEDFHTILRSSGIDPFSVEIVNGGRTSSDALTVVDCQPVEERYFDQFRRNLESPKYTPINPKKIAIAEGDNIEICLGMLAHNVGGEIIEELCASASKNGFVKHSIKGIYMGLPNANRMLYPGRRLRERLEGQGRKLSDIIITRGQRTTSEGLRRVRCSPLSDSARDQFTREFHYEEVPA